jgi:hypothetical protein
MLISRAAARLPEAYKARYRYVKNNELDHFLCIKVLKLYSFFSFKKVGYRYGYESDQPKKWICGSRSGSTTLIPDYASQTISKSFFRK